MRTITTLLLTLILVAPGGAQDFDDVEIRTERVANGLYVLYGAGGNIGLSVGSQSVFLIDDQYAPLTPKILAAVRSITDRPIRFVLNTHWHGDHTGGNEAMGAAGAVLVAHENVRQRLSTGQFMELMQRDVPPAPEAALPEVTFQDGLRIYLNGTIEAVHYPHAHTDGDAVVYFDDVNAVHMGDLFFSGGYPFVDYGSGGSLSGLIDGVEAVLARTNPDFRIIPGHGQVTGQAGLRSYRDMLVTVRDRVRRMAAGGATLEEIQAAAVSAEFDDEWGQGFIDPETFIGFAFRDARE